MKLLFMDLETTGLDPEKNGVIQIAGIVDINGAMVDEFNFRCRPYPDQVINGQALETTGLKLSQIEAFPDPGEAFSGLMGVLNRHVNRFDKKDKFYLVGQNPNFDYQFLQEFFSKNLEKYLYAYINYHLIDLVALTAAFQVAGRHNVPNMKLSTVAAHYGVKLEAHDALNDIRACRELFYKYIGMIKEEK